MSAREFCVLSLPRQGKDFFMSCVGPEGRYLREWFNPVSNYGPEVKKVLLPFFGSEADEHRRGLFLTPSDEEFELALESWRGRGLNLAKEVWSFSKSHLFARSMPTVYMFRSRRHTFPSSMPNFFLSIWTAFLEFPPSLDLAKEIKSHVESRRLYNPAERQVVIHAAAWAIQYFAAPLPVLHYDRMMELSSNDLVEHLLVGLPDWMNIQRVAERIESTRRWDRRAREESYSRFVSGTNAEREIELLAGFLEGLGLGRADWLF